MKPIKTLEERQKLINSYNQLNTTEFAQTLINYERILIQEEREKVKEAVLKMDEIFEKFEHTRDCFARKAFKEIFGDFEK